MQPETPTDTAISHALAVQELRKQYDKITAVDDVSFQVGRGNLDSHVALLPVHAEGFEPRQGHLAGSGARDFGFGISGFRDFGSSLDRRLNPQIP